MFTVVLRVLFGCTSFTIYVSKIYKNIHMPSRAEPISFTVQAAGALRFLGSYLTTWDIFCEFLNIIKEFGHCNSILKKQQMLHKLGITVVRYTCSVTYYHCSCRVILQFSPPSLIMSSMQF